MPPPSRGSDIVIGDCYGEAAAPELIGAAQRALAQLGFSVMPQCALCGGYTTNLYGKPDLGVHALQIEVSRALYLDELRMEKNAASRTAKSAWSASRRDYWAHGRASSPSDRRRIISS
jgi:N-formylglutamate deformylase